MTLAILDVSAELLGEVAGSIKLAPTITVLRSLEAPFGGTVRLELDVTATGKPGGLWQGLISRTSGGLTIEFGPVSPVVCDGVPSMFHHPA